MNPPPDLRKISETIWEIPPSHKKGMRVPARIYATEKLMAVMDEGVFDQITNVARLPGILKYAFCLPDGHRGYGFPIGGVAAIDPEEGVISPGGIGFDINCGMRLVLTDLAEEEVRPRLKKLVDSLFSAIPSGVGGGGMIKLDDGEFRKVVEEGAAWCVRSGYGWEEDLERTEYGGSYPGADSSTVSPKAISRGKKQVGSLGSGNHYLEVQVARPENIYDRETARELGISRDNQVGVMIHCGSRGFGHQVASDYLQLFVRVMEKKYGIRTGDRELACAPFRSKEGRDYFAAMKCAVNMAFANRQAILHRVREVFADVFKKSPEDLGMGQVYDVTHNTAVLEKHEVDGEEKELLVHRKGATRAFPPGREELPEIYRKIGQPVIIGGSMETGSHLMVGVEEGKQTFYSTAHGSGRVMSRTAARKKFYSRSKHREMEEKGIYVRTSSFSGLAEEAAGAYKDIDEVVRATDCSGLSRSVVRFTPIGNVKG